MSIWRRISPPIRSARLGKSSESITSPNDAPISHTVKEHHPNISGRSIPLSVFLEGLSPRRLLPPHAPPPHHAPFNTVILRAITVPRAPDPYLRRTKRICHDKAITAHEAAGEGAMRREEEELEEA